MTRAQWAGSVRSGALLSDPLDEDRLAARAAAAARRDAVITLAFDLACWLVGLFLALAIRFGFDPPWERLRAVLLFAPLSLVLQALIGDFAGIYRNKRARPAFDDLLALTIATVLTTAAAAGFNWALDPSPVPLSVPLAGGVLALMGQVFIRSVRRSLAERHRAALD
jgi:hypothetical protein